MKNYFAVILLLFTLTASQACAEEKFSGNPAATPRKETTTPKSVAQKQMMEQEKKELAAMKNGVEVDDIYVACKYYFSKLFNTRENMGRKNICNGYFFGAASMILLLQDEEVETDTCVPMDVSTEEIIKGFLKWSDENPDKNKMQASKALLEMIRENYPCNEYDPEPQPKEKAD